jgi:Pyruvate/2-oxoacid:ferredoxin oxidoreductase delta subunit
MDSNGPAHGRVRDLGLVAVSDNGLSLDVFLEKTLSIRSPLPISSLGKEKGLLKEAMLVDQGAPQIRDFVMPAAVEVDWNLPPLVRETVRHMFTRKPKWDSKRCNVCNACVNVCPAGALRAGGKGLLFDYKACIRCYCCHEMCPTGAITV